MSGCNSSHYEANSFPIVCAVLALHSWNCSPGEQGLTALHLLLNVCLYGFIELDPMGFPVVWHLVAQ